jgi:hypothetical protein
MATDYEEKTELQELTSLKNINVTSFEAQQTAMQMAKDGFNSEQIAEALGYSVKAINNFTQMSVEVGSPEEVLQEGLRTVLSLIPIAEAQYRERPAATYAYTLTGFIESARSLIAQAYTLKSKEDVYRSVLAKVLQPLCREMIKSMLGEVGILNSNSGNGISEADLKTFSTNLGKKFQECYRKSTEDLGGVLGVSPDARARILSGSNEPVD